MKEIFNPHSDYCVVHYCVTMFFFLYNRIDMTIGPIEESFAMMNRYGLVYSSSDSERVDGLTYAWRKLHAQVGES